MQSKGFVAGLIVPLSCLFQISPAHANDSPSSSEFGQIVVTGTRSEKTLLDSPVRTEVITRATIERLQAYTLQDALRYVPGLMLRRIHGKSGDEVWMQGLDGDRVLILVNGQPLPASTGSTVDLSQVDLADVKQIEIVKGAQSALYGSSAMGGVVNIITENPNKPFSWQVQGDGGGFDQPGGSWSPVRRFSGNLDANTKTFGANLSASLRDSDGFSMTPGETATDGYAGHKVNIAGTLRWQPTDNIRWTLLPDFYQENIDSNYSNFAPGVGKIPMVLDEKAERRGLTGGFLWSDSKGRRLNATLSQTHFTDTTAEDAVQTSWIDQQRKANMTISRAEIDWSQPLGDRHVFAIGLLGQRQTLTQTLTTNDGTRVQVEDEIGGNGQAVQNNFEAYIQDDYFLNDEWELLPGVRFQHDSGFGGKATPKISLMFHPGQIAGQDVRFRASVGQGYRTPNLKERYYVFDHSAIGYKVLGNVNLRPESSTSYQLGMEMTGADQSYHLDLNFYRNDIRDLISVVDAGLNNGIMIFQYDNIGHARTQGVETTLRVPITSRLSANVGYTYLDATDRQTGKQLVLRPKNMVKAGLDLNLPSWRSRLGVYLNWEDKQFADDANTLVSPAWTHLDLRWDSKITHNLSLYVGVNNLTDIHRNAANPADYRPLEPRYVYAGLRWKN